MYVIFLNRKILLIFNFIYCEALLFTSTVTVTHAMDFLLISFGTVLQIKLIDHIKCPVHQTLKLIHIRNSHVYHRITWIAEFYLILYFTSIAL